MDIAPYPTSEKSHHSKAKVFHSTQNLQSNLSLRVDSIPTVCQSSRKQLYTEHLSPTSPSDDDHQSFTSYNSQIALESASEKASAKKKSNKPNPKAFVSLVEAKAPETRSRLAAPGLCAHDILARRANTSRNNDRFIPRRLDHSIFITKHRIRKHPGELTVNEKLSRQQECSEDPFDRRPSQGILPSSLLNRGLLQAPHMSPHIVDDQTLPNQYSSFNGRMITPRQVSVGGIWNVGGSSIATRDPRLGTTHNQRGLYEDKAATPMHVARYEYSTHISSSEELEMNQSRLAIAFDIDLIRPQLTICKLTKSNEIGPSPSSPEYEKFKCPLVWKDCEWKRAELLNFHTARRRSQKGKERVPFCILVTPGIIDDFYCTVLAYSHTLKVLAYAIMDIVYLWSTTTCRAVAAFPAGHPNSDHVTALSFSSPEGQKGILAVATWRGYLYLWSLVKPLPRRIWQYHISISCVAFKQTTTRRLSTIFSGTEAFVEDLVVADKAGIIWYYCVESSHLDTLSKVTLLARIDAHCGCICGISWSPDSKYLATSGDDNACLLFDLNRILGGHCSQGSPLIGDYLIPGVQPLEADSYSMTGLRFLHIFRRLSRLATDASLLTMSRSVPNLSTELSISNNLESLRYGLGMNQNQPQRRPETWRQRRSSFTGSNISDNFHAARILGLQDFLPGLSIGPLDSQGVQTAKFLPYNSQTHRFMHRSAVKAIAFAPWQPTLLATGGGMGDRTVHFYHTPSGSCLAKIYVWAQVTGLVWSTTRREIAVILGFSEGEHPFRIAVFAWPSCEQTAAIPWNINLYGQVFPDLHVSERALAAISIPGFRCPPCDGEGDTSSADDECIAIISKGHIRFYRIWSRARKFFGGSTGILHSAILESLDGIKNPGNEVIR